MTSVNDIRSMFLDYFVRNGHAEVASSPLVPQNDPTLMFTNSGMVQFKNVFTGLENRDYTRAVSSQKCVRAGGKHNDLENVGYTARHHTFFEMLGNFSFGDYFKEEAIHNAWQLVTGELGLNKDKLIVTVYSEDEQAAALWRKIGGLSDDRIIRISTTDNFWSMGDTGPCGPCSEIFYDHGPHIFGGPPGSPDEDGDRFIEIWNLVFMQYEQTEGGRLDLPRPSIDTGMGLERIAAVLQGTHDNYDIDLMRALIEASADASNTDADGPKNVSHRVVADHLRSAGFLIADGVLPSNEGRGYVLRRIMRRAMRHLHQLDCDDPVMFQLVPALVREMGGHYPELVRAQPLISETLKLEEARFKEALARGLKILTTEVEGKASGGTLSGETAFKLYDTYGFPLDLTEDFMRGYDWQVDIAGFDSAMKAQKEAARAAWSGSGSKADERILFELADRHGATEFLGYSRLSSEAVVNAIVKDGAEVSHLGVGESGLLVTNQTPFYGESGGQMGDTGLVQSGEVLGHVTDTQKTAAGLFLHHVTVDKGQFETDMPVSFVVDEARRTSLCANHSATHLLHEALRIVLGEHVAQKGSLVAPDRVRFDFSHSIAMSAAEISAVEDIVNARIRMNSDVSTRLMTPDEAVKEGALALFGEKYGDEVRVVSMGGASDISGKSAWSVELCGGIHVAHTGDIALLKVISESAVAGGVRRIEAVTHAYGLAYLAGRDATLSRAAQILKASPDQLEGRLEQLLDDRRKMEREISSLRQKLATGGADDNDSEMLGNISYRGKVLDDTPARELKAMADAMRSNASGTVICLVATDAGKASIVVSVTDDLIGQMDAVALVKAGSAALGGAGGGGRADMAQAGGPNANAAADAVDAVRQAVLAAG
ncbi:MAG: alanine--tRNA ligase [Alphaproteobacteria bacterium]|jgi:alanyl-tRNA synthetase|nr:alanine--tRNA ligase [Alphaproteobacteria bacterium]